MWLFKRVAGGGWVEFDLDFKIYYLDIIIQRNSRTHFRIYHRTLDYAAAVNL
jgi:hypothetical protein